MRFNSILFARNYKVEEPLSRSVSYGDLFKPRQGKAAQAAETKLGDSKKRLDAKTKSRNGSKPAALKQIPRT